MSLLSTQSVPTATSSDTSTSTEVPGYHVGVGLVEISTLGTLIGATSAEALASGNKAAAGLPWASMSTFGSFYSIKGAVACMVPDWVRETLGLKSGFTDASLGLNTIIDTSRTAKQRAGTDVASGVWIPYHGDWEEKLRDEFREEKKLGEKLKEPYCVEGAYLAS